MVLELLHLHITELSTPSSELLSLVHYLERQSELEIFCTICKMMCASAEFCTALAQEMDIHVAVLLADDKEQNVIDNISSCDFPGDDSDNEETAPTANATNTNTNKSKNKSRNKVDLVQFANTNMPTNIHAMSIAKMEQQFSEYELCAFCAKLGLMFNSCSKRFYASSIYFKFHGEPAKWQQLHAKYAKMNKSELKKLCNVRGNYTTKYLIALCTCNEFYK